MLGGVTFGCSKGEDGAGAAGEGETREEECLMPPFVPLELGR